MKKLNWTKKRSVNRFIYSAKIGGYFLSLENWDKESDWWEVYIRKNKDSRNFVFSTVHRWNDNPTAVGVFAMEQYARHLENRSVDLDKQICAVQAEWDGCRHELEAVRKIVGNKHAVEKK